MTADASLDKSGQGVASIVDSYQLFFDGAGGANNGLYIGLPTGRDTDLGKVVAGLRSVGLWSDGEIATVPDKHKPLYRSQLEFAGAAAGQDFFVFCLNHPKYPVSTEQWGRWLSYFKKEYSMSEAGVEEATVTADDLAAFAAAWNAHDVDALMSFMTDDCIFDGSAGPDVMGTRFQGYDEVRAGYQKIFDVFPDAKWNDDRHFVSGDRGVSEWVFTGTMADGSRVEVQGCDLFIFRGNKIYLKDSIRKNRPPLAAK